MPLRASTSARLRIDRHLSERSQRRLADDVFDGLTKPFKELPPKHFYDARGSQLFERICEQPEYYPTRTELAILADSCEEVIERTGAGELVELGSGAATKARMLLGAMEAAGTLERYVPLDVSESALVEAADELLHAFPELDVHGLVGDLERHLPRIPAPDGTPRLVAFLGGTIGNFPPGTRRRLLREVRDMLAPGDHLLLGTDLVKDPAVLEAAYDDGAGVTAEFNRNVLRVVNRELDADFDPGAFEHVAFYDAGNEWVEMRLRATRPCTVRIGALDHAVEFERGEELRTEISAKFTRGRLLADFADAGLAMSGWFSDPDELFAVTLATPADE